MLTSMKTFFALFLLAAFICNHVTAQSQVSLTTFTDIKCKVPSTTAVNVTLPIDACITTIGLGSYLLPALPCAGGGLTALAIKGYSDAHCAVAETPTLESAFVNCYGYGYTDGHAFGSIVLTCRDPVKLSGATTTINVGPVLTGASSPTNTAVTSTDGGSSGGSSGSTSNSGSSSTSDSSNCSGFSCLTLGEKIGIYVALGVGIPPIIIGLIALRQKRKKRKHNEMIANMGHEHPQETHLASRFRSNPDSFPMGAMSSPQPPPPYYPQQQFNPHYNQQQWKGSGHPQSSWNSA